MNKKARGYGNTAELSDPLFLPTLPEVFKDIYYYLYSNSNIPRAERLASELTRILFCKVYDETKGISNRFYISDSESDAIIGDRIRSIFKEVKDEYKDVFDHAEKIHLDDRSIGYIIGKLQLYQITKTERDVIAEAFQVFWGPSIRGEKGQFFTPRNVVKMCVALLDPKPGERIIDPACGSGGFLIEALNYVEDIDSMSNIYGIDKEFDLVKICNTYLRLIGKGHPNIYCADSLNPTSWDTKIKTKIIDGSFDLVLTNPPFGAKIFINDRNLLSAYELGHEWKKNPDNKWSGSIKIKKQVPQILFIERCLKLLRTGGRMAIILPDGVFGNSSDSYVWEYILKNAEVRGVISLPQETFMPSTHTKTSVLILNKRVPTGNNAIFMAIPKKVGHDKNGKTILKIENDGTLIKDNKGQYSIDDDLPIVVEYFYKDNTVRDDNHLGFYVDSNNINNYVFIPAYYDPKVKNELEIMVKTGQYRLMTLGELRDEGVISVKRGNEVGSKYYGLGNIPFIRTSDLVNWEIKIDPIKCVPNEIYNRYKDNQDIRENDILFVSDGTFLIGKTSIVTDLDNKIIIQSHIKRIRSEKPNELHPFLLLYIFNTDIVQKQIQEKTFVQATISTLGNRLYEVVLPIPNDNSISVGIIDEVAKIISYKAKAKKKIYDLYN